MIADESYTEGNLRSAIIGAIIKDSKEGFDAALKLYVERFKYDTIVSLLDDVNVCLRNVNASHVLLLIVDDESPHLTIQAATKESVDKAESLTYNDFATLTKG